MGDDTRRVGLGRHMVDELAGEQRIERRKDFVKEDMQEED